MSESQNAGFSQFVPGFDFLQNLAKGAAPTVPQMPNLSSWIAPTLNLEELDKRISELKAVHFWLDQNSKALGATVQALEVQKMTLATLKGMNLKIGEMASALTPKAAEPAAGTPKATEKPAASSKTIAEMAAETESVAEKATDKASPEAKPAAATVPPGLVDPLQLWGALTQQFQQIAASAMKDAGKTSALDLTKNMAAGFAKEAVKATAKTTAKPKAPVKKVARKTSTRKV